VVQQKLFSALAQTEEIDHAEIARLVHAVADLGRVSFAYQRWTADIRRRKKERRHREENALIASDLQEMLLDPRDDDLIDDDLDQLDDEPTPSTIEQTREVPSD
jgi:hypothetical protein